MTTIEAIISSSLLTSILGHVINWFVNRSNYKKDYYQKVIDRRLDAYEKLNTVVSQLSMLTQVDKKILIHTICLNEKNFVQNLDNLQSSTDLAFWLEKDTKSKLSELNAFLINEIYNKVDSLSLEGNIDDEYIKLGVVHKIEISSLRNKIQNLMNKDIKGLYKLETYFK